MPEKTVSVKCEVNEKNNAAIKHFLSVAFGLDHSLWQDDVIEGRGESSLMSFRIKIDEALDSKGYIVYISFCWTGLGFFYYLLEMLFHWL